MRLDVVASLRHYADHLRPVWDALEPAERGTFARTARRLTGDAVLVASYRDLLTVRRRGRPIIFFEHGCGYTYDDLTADAGTSYAGGGRRDDVVLFVSPNEYVRRRNQHAWPGVPEVVVGSPRMDELLRVAKAYQRDTLQPMIAVSFHWRCDVVPEAEPATTHFQAALPDLAARFTVLGHGHPRDWEALRRMWRGLEVEPVADFADVVRRADLYVVDTSSTLYEFAALDRPVVVLNAPWYRRDVRHGLRFWEHSDVGLNVDEPADLVATVTTALRDSPEMRARRGAATAAVFPFLGDSARRAVAAIRERLA